MPRAAQMQQLQPPSMPMPPAPQQVKTQDNPQQSPAAPQKKQADRKEGPVMLPLPSEDSPEAALTVSERIQKFRSQTLTQVVSDETFQPVQISEKDITRISCFTDIAKVVYSKEKGIEVKTKGRDAFVKNLPREITHPISNETTIRYDPRPKELYVICGTATFSLQLVPADIPAATIYLKTAYADREKAQRFERATDYENTILALMKAAYAETIPDGYEIDDVNKVVRKYNESDLIHRRDYNGTMFQLREYVLVAHTHLQIDEIQMIEELRPANLLAITVVDTVLEPRQQTRIFVVRTYSE